MCEVPIHIKSIGQRQMLFMKTPKKNIQKKNFFTNRQTDRRTTQNYKNKEPHNKNWTIYSN